MASIDPRHTALLNSLRQRYREAQRLGDAVAKQGLFKEAVYLGIQPQLLDTELEPTDPISSS